MRVEIKMPDLATADDEVTLVRWLVNVGQTIKLGEPLLEIETDKATMDVEAVAAGTLVAIQVEAGDRVGVGQVIAVIENDVPETATATPVQAAPQPVIPVQAAVQAPATTPKAGSFFARNKAARAQTQVNGASIPLSGLQREVARRLQESSQNIPHFYLTSSANAERIAALRNEASKKIVWDAFFVKAVAKALQEFERLRYRFDGDKLTRNPDAIGVAADINDDLYVVPVDNPLSLTLEQISDQIMSRVEQIRGGDASARKLSGTCMTITNLGAENIDAFQAIINPPEAAILAIGRIAPTVWAQNGQVVVQQRVSLSLSADHRVVNGKYAARFLSRVIHEIETMQG
jgi:pyruvate dehydrogenase E2 component (dihydrolipoamide acetyltransferase)